MSTWHKPDDLLGGYSELLLQEGCGTIICLIDDTGGCARDATI